MIYGIGTDLLNVSRIRAAYAARGDRFAQRILGDDEFVVFQKRMARHFDRGILYLATRFAAKEAGAKALGTGFSGGVFMKDIGVVNDASGKPTLVMTGGALKRLNTLTLPGQKIVIHLTLTDEPPLAQAHVIIECV